MNLYEVKELRGGVVVVLHTNLLAHLAANLLDGYRQHGRNVFITLTTCAELTED